jgi:hypothetical protein
VTELCSSSMAKTEMTPVKLVREPMSRVMPLSHLGMLLDRSSEAVQLTTPACGPRVRISQVVLSVSLLAELMPRRVESEDALHQAASPG